MKKPPCARLGIRISPNASEKPDDSRNSNPPNAMLLRVWMIQNCMAIYLHRIVGRAKGMPERSEGASVPASVLIAIRCDSHGGHGARPWRDCPTSEQAPLPALRGDVRRTIAVHHSRFFAGG